jgi:hypothetical protein
MPINFPEILSTLEGKILDLAKTTVSNYVTAAKKDSKKLLDTIKDDLQRWTQELADNKITTKDFETLVIGDKDLVEMTALTKAGLFLARVDQFKSSVFNLIIDTVFQMIKI